MRTHTDETRKRISDGAVAVWHQRKLENANLARLGFRQLLYSTGELRPRTPDHELARKALKLALRDGKFPEIERKTLRRYLRALEAGRRIKIS